MADTHTNEKNTLFPQATHSETEVNTITIEADQLSAKWLGCYGCDAAHTPNIDRLATSGTRFANCFSNHPVCMPARASTITGRSAQFHGLYYNGWELGEDIPTFPRELQHHGVQTLGVGKYHLECHGRSAHNDVLKYGFDRAEVTEDIRAGDWLDWVEREHPEDASAALATCWPMQSVRSYGPNKRNLQREIQEAKRIAPRPTSAQNSFPTPLPEHVCQTRWTVDRSIAMLRGRDPSRPFFLKTSFVDPHDPYDPPKRFLDLIDRDAIQPPVEVEDPTLLHLVEKLQTNKFVQRHANLDAEAWIDVRWHYLASLAFLDEQVGRLLGFLEDEGLAENTLVMLFSDHGDMLGDQGLPAKGSWHFDACMHVPMIVSGPAVDAGRVESTVVTNLDVFPTLMEAAGIQSKTPVEGESLLTLCRGGALDRPDAALVESHGGYGSTGGVFSARTVVTPNARMTLFRDGSGMLFDTEVDPLETQNLYDTPQADALQRQLERLMLELWARQSDRLPTHRQHPCASH